MPSAYAHYRFGTQMLEALPGDISRPIQRFRHMYDLGLYGPDIFYYTGPVLKSDAGFMGIKFHEQTGREFFVRVCRMLRQERPEAGIAYLHGVLCHYCLDSMLHPFVMEQAALGNATHMEIETEFDRFLLQTDGKTSADLTGFLPRSKLTPGEYDAIANFYPPASGRNVKKALHNTVYWLRLLATPEGTKRKLLETGMKLTDKSLQGMFMTTQPNDKCAELNEQLLALYEKAQAQMPILLHQLQEHMTHGEPFEEAFAPSFGGECPTPAEESEA